MTVMEPRVAERRKSVSEDRARRRLRWILAFIMLIALIAGGIWLIRSPVLSIRSVDINGAKQSDTQGVMRTLGVGIGTPTIDVHGDAIATAIGEDPWVEDVTVSVAWPGSVIIDIKERTPIAPVLAGDQWVVVGLDGGAIMTVPQAASSNAVVSIDQGTLAPGSTVNDPSVLGALQFINALTPARRAGMEIQMEETGLVATLGSHRIRLGRPIDMVLKASVLEELLDTDLPAGAMINLIAPLRPAVANPQPEVEAQE